MKEIVDSGNIPFATALNNSEKLLQTLGEVGKVDAKLKIDQKGKSLFDSKSKFFLLYLLNDLK